MNQGSDNTYDSNYRVRSIKTLINTKEISESDDVKIVNVGRWKSDFENWAIVTCTRVLICSLVKTDCLSYAMIIFALGRLLGVISTAVDDVIIHKAVDRFIVICNESRSIDEEIDEADLNYIIDEVNKRMKELDALCEKE